jgi:hypothetical protein
MLAFINYLQQMEDRNRLAQAAAAIKCVGDNRRPIADWQRDVGGSDLLPRQSFSHGIGSSATQQFLSGIILNPFRETALPAVMAFPDS